MIWCEEIENHLLSCGFEQVSKSVFRRGDTEIKILDGLKYVRISIMDKNTGMDLSLYSEVELSDISLLDLS